jgi:plastocyanin
MTTVAKVMLVAAFGTGALLVADDKDERQGGKASTAMRLITWQVQMTSGNVFEPDNLPDVKVGDAVEFINAGGTHTATSVTAPEPAYMFNTSTMKKGQRTSIFFNKAGEYDYKCLHHNAMTGKIKVSP